MSSHLRQRVSELLGKDTPYECTYDNSLEILSRLDPEELVDQPVMYRWDNLAGKSVYIGQGAIVLLSSLSSTTQLPIMGHKMIMPIKASAYAITRIGNARRSRDRSRVLVELGYTEAACKSSQSFSLLVRGKHYLASAGAQGLLQQREVSKAVSILNKANSNTVDEDNTFNLLDLLNLPRGL